MHYRSDSGNTKKSLPTDGVYYIVDEPMLIDTEKEVLIGTTAEKVIRTAAEIYEVDPLHPTLITGYPVIGQFYSFYIYGETTDIFAIAPYSMIFQCREPEKNSDYLAQAKLASQPKLVWFIPEAFTYKGSRFPTPEEERINVYSAIGRGAKGIWYYVYDKEIGYPANKALEEEIGKINRQLQMLKEYIVISEPVSFSKVMIEKVTPYTLLCGDRAIILILVNNDYQSNFKQDQIPFSCNPKQNFEVCLEIPRWLKVKQVKEIWQGGREVPYLFDEGGHLLLSIENFDITKQFLIVVERR
ncbi:MAG: hypothetical protein NC906_09040 [Candidatus Omnitrophica bacterium]|nr:hypothetical protein [Candidatus Omnitrophota bacterium]